MVSSSRILGAAVALLAFTSIACGGSPDGAPGPGGPSGEGTNGGATYDESGNPIAIGDVPDPSAGEEGSGDLPAPDGGVPGFDGGVPPAGDGGPAPSDGGSTPPPPPPPPPPGTIGASLVAIEAARELSVMKTSTYDHTTSVDETKGQFNYDCSGFVGYDLTRVLPDALSTIVAASGTSRPLAKHFEAFFEAIPTGGKTGRWHRVVNVADLVPGDVVAWLKPADVASTNTGHVLIVRLAVSKNPKRSDEWLVPITDSTSTPHGATDSRTATGATGLGTGTIGLLVDAKGAPVGYRWTGGVSAHDEITSISLGHAE